MARYSSPQGCPHNANCDGAPKGFITNHQGIKSLLVSDSVVIELNDNFCLRVYWKFE